MRTLILLLCLLSSCSKTQAPPGRVDVYQFTGEVLKVDPAKNRATIKHGPMTDPAGKVWMEAMTMEFPVKNPKEIALLHPGVKIKGKLFQRPADFDYWVAEIQVLE